MRRVSARKSRRAEGGGTLRFVLFVAIAAWLFRSFLFAPFSIPSGSMLPTLFIGDYLVVSKWPYGYSRYSFPFGIPPISGRILSDLPDRGDVVVFRPPGEEGEDFIKRVIGLPGDTVEVRDGAVILNGKPLARSKEEPFAVPISVNSPCRRITPKGIAFVVTQAPSCVYSTYVETLPEGPNYRVIDQLDTAIADNFPATRVPAGRLFLMGDNRDDSLDSRYSIAEGGIGMVPLDHLVGRADMIFWSTNGSASYLKPWTWFTALRGSRIGDSLTVGHQ